MKDSNIEFGTTNRGFALGKFKDRNGVECSLQKSSIADEACIWFGCDEHGAQIFVPNGNPSWRPFDIPKEVLLNTRMHLTQEQVKELLPALEHFAKTGELPS